MLPLGEIRVYVPDANDAGYVSVVVVDPLEGESASIALDADTTRMVVGWLLTAVERAEGRGAG